MVFQQPLFLYGLFFLAIPILIHFLNFRKSKTIYFSSLRFIEEIKSNYRKRNRLTDLLLLLLRLVIIAGVVIAFAQPVIPASQLTPAAPSSILGLFIDNSQSMTQTEQGESLLEKAKTKAKEVVSGLSPDTRFLVLYNGSNAEFSSVTDKEMTLKLIDGIRPSGIPFSMDEVMRFFSQESHLKDVKLASIILLSDFQETLFTKPLSMDSSHISVFPLPIRPASSDNISVDTCWLENPMTLIGQNNQVIARINNRSSKDYEEFPVRLVINDTLRNETSVRLPSHTITEVSLNFHPNAQGWQSGYVQISDFPVIFDNELFFSFRIESDIPVLQLYGGHENSFLRKAYGSDPYFKFDSFTVKGFPRSDFNDYNLVILCGQPMIDARLSEKIQSYLKKGGTVWFLPEMNGDIASYDSFLKSLSVSEIQSVANYRMDSKVPSDQYAWLQEVIINLDKRLRLPYFNASFKISPTSAAAGHVDLLQAVSGDVLLSQFKVGSGSFVLSGFPLDELVTDFMYHPLFIPVCYRIALMKKSSASLYQLTGTDLPYKVDRGIKTNQLVRLKSSKSQLEIVPIQHDGTGSETLLWSKGLTEPGRYDALSGRDTVAQISYNYSRAESSLNYLSDSILYKRFKNTGWNITMNNYSFSERFSKEFGSRIAVKKMWIYFLIISLVALMIESVVMNQKK